MKKGSRSYAGKAWGFTEILLLRGRMSFLTIRADYLGFGPIFPTSTKSNHDPVVGIQGMKHIRGLTMLPVFAIGGITIESVRALRQAGANGVAVACSSRSKYH